MPSRAWVVTLDGGFRKKLARRFNALTGLSCYNWRNKTECRTVVSMPSWAWVVTILHIHKLHHYLQFQCPHGLELLQRVNSASIGASSVSMPSWAWVVTARMSNILNFSWYFLCIPAIYRCILAYITIFFNQLSKFLRCESPSTFLGTCLSHHSFIIFLVTNTNTLLSGLYLISTATCFAGRPDQPEYVSMPSRAYTSFLRSDVNGVDGILYECQCPLGLIPHFYGTPSKT